MTATHRAVRVSAEPGIGALLAAPATPSSDAPCDTITYSNFEPFHPWAYFTPNAEYATVVDNEFFEVK